MPEQKARWVFKLSHTSPFPLGGGVWSIFINSSTHFIFVILERTLTREQFVSVANARQRRALRREEISCDKYRRGNDRLRRQWTDWPGEKRWERERENEREGERQVVSGTIQLPSELYWISPPFKIKRQISLNPPFWIPEEESHYFFQTAQEPEPFSCPLFKESSI